MSCGVALHQHALGVRLTDQVEGLLGLSLLGQVVNADFAHAFLRQLHRDPSAVTAGAAHNQRTLQSDSHVLSLSASPTPYTYTESHNRGLSVVKGDDTLRPHTDDDRLKLVGQTLRQAGGLVGRHVVFEE